MPPSQEHVNQLTILTLANVITPLPLRHQYHSCCELSITPHTPLFWVCNVHCVLYIFLSVNTLNKYELCSREVCHLEHTSCFKTFVLNTHTALKLRQLRNGKRANKINISDQLLLYIREKKTDTPVCLMSISVMFSAMLDEELNVRLNVMSCIFR